jgi:hypothetical protein
MLDGRRDQAVVTARRAGSAFRGACGSASGTGIVVAHATSAGPALQRAAFSRLSILQPAMPSPPGVGPRASGALAACLPNRWEMAPSFARIASQHSCHWRRDIL